MFDDTYQNTVELGSVAVFDNVECSKAQAMKVLEEAAEAFGAWQKLDKDTFSDPTDPTDPTNLIAELCDVIQACCNMAAAVGCDDLRLALWDCEDRNRKRGRITGMVDRGNRCTREKCKRFVFVPVEVSKDSWEAIENDSGMIPFAYCKKFGLVFDGMEAMDCAQQMYKHLFNRCKAMGGAE